MVGGLADLGERIGTQQHRVRATHTGEAQLRQCQADGLRNVARILGQVQWSVRRRRTNALDPRGRVAFEDRAVLRERDLLGSSFTASRSTSWAPRSTLSSSSRESVNDTRSSTTDATRCCRARTPSAGASISLVRPRPTAAKSVPCGPEKSTTVRPATCRLNVRPASSSISAHAASVIGASSRYKLFTALNSF